MELNGAGYYRHGLYDMFAAYAAYAVAAASSQCEPPRAKKRKIETASASSSASSTSTSTLTTSASGDTSRLIVDRRGHVTFRPYSDSLENPRQPYLIETQSPLNRNRTGFSGSFPAAKSSKGLPDSSCSEDKKVQHQECTIGNLFPEILSTIFEYLDVQSKGRAAQVSTRWRDAANRKSVWKNIEAKLHLHRQSQALFSSLVKRGIKKVQVLSLKKSLREMIIGLPNLESLNLSGCYNLSDIALETAFSKEVATLKVLNLSLCKDVTDGSLRRITANCKNLEILDLAGCSKITNHSLFYISMLRKVKKLNLRSCRMISDSGIADLCNTSGLENSRRTLEELCLQDCQKLTDESLRHISLGLPELEKINLSFCVSITDTGLKSISRIGTLRDLNLRSCDNISDIGIGFLAENGLNLHFLDVSFCANITDSAMRHIASGISSLQSLSLTTCSIGDEGLAKISKALSDLQVLNIGQCVAITDEGLMSLAEHSSKLKSLDLYGCPNVTSNALALVRKLPKLERLNLNL